MNEVQICLGHPNEEGNWSHAGLFSGGRAILRNLTPGVVVYVRVRTCGIRGVLGAWSDVAGLMVV